MTWTATPEAPTRKVGTGWSPTAPAPGRQNGRGWFSTLGERIAALSGSGTLAVTIDSQHSPSDPAFRGSGALTVLVRPNVKLAVAFSGLGLPTATASRAAVANASFGGSGSLSVLVNDGLTAIVQPGVAIAAQFSGSGALTVGGADGLTVDVGPGVIGTVAPVDAEFVGTGQLYASAVAGDGLSVGVYGIVAGGGPPAVSAPFAGSGSLSVNVISYRVAEGMLTVLVVPGVTSAPVSVPLSGSGALTATAKRRHLMSAGFAGSGSLTATVTAGTPAGPDITDDFNRADSSTSLGANWTNRLNSVGISGNVAYPVIGGAGWCIASHNTPLGSDDMEASAIVLGSNENRLLGLGFSATGDGMFVYYNGTTYELYHQTDWASWSFATGSGAVSQNIGDKITVRRVGEVYSILQNNVERLSWTDTGGVLTRDSSHRLLQIGLIDNARWESFEARAL